MTKKIYFAGSIRGGRRDQKVYNQFISYTQSLGAQVLCEHVGYADLTDQGQDMSPVDIHNRDLAWIDESNGVIAEVTNPSLGVGYELKYALDSQKPVLALFAKMVDGPRLSAMIAGAVELHPHLQIHEYVRSERGMRLAQLAIDSFLDSLDTKQLMVNETQGTILPT